MVALAAPGSALAAGSASCQAYNPELCENITVSTTAPAATSASTLPFTGLDIGLLLAGGAGLAGAGVAVRRLARESDRPQR